MTGISIGDLARGRRSFNMETELGSIRITYRPYQMTPAREAEIARMGADVESEDSDVEATERGITKLVHQFCEVVESTDLVGPLHKAIDPDTGLGIGDPIVEDGQPIPIKPEVVRYFSSYFILQILQAVAKDVRPKKDRERN